MSNGITLKAPNSAYKVLNAYKAKLNNLASVTDKIRRFFLNKDDKAKEINEIQVKLKTYGKELQELCWKYYEDKKFRDKVQKLLKMCKKLCKSFGIKDDITAGYVRVYGPLIKGLIPRYKVLIDEAIGNLKEKSEGAGDFVNEITSYYSKIRSSLAKIEYKDKYIAKLFAVFDALDMFFRGRHWENVTKSQEKIIKLLVEMRTYLEKMEIKLKKGGIDWEEAYKGINENVGKEGNFDKQVEEWNNIQYFSKDKLEESQGGDDFFNAYWGGKGLEDTLKAKFDDATKNDIKSYVKSEVSKELSKVCSEPNIKSACEKVMENSFKKLLESIKGRKMFEQSCEKVYIKLGEEAACTMYDVVVNHKSFGDKSDKCNYQLEYSGCNPLGDGFTISGNNLEEILNNLWKNRGISKEIKKRRLFSDKVEELKMNMPGTISVQ